jgi:hypothetical protein
MVRAAKRNRQAMIYIDFLLNFMCKYLIQNEIKRDMHLKYVVF